MSYPLPIRNRNSSHGHFHRRLLFPVFLLSLLLALFSGGVLRATAEDLYAPQGASPTALPAQATTPSPPVSGDLLQQRIEDLERRVVAAENAVSSATADALGVSLDELRQRVAILRENAAYLRRTKTALEDRAVLQKELASLREKLAAGTLDVPRQPPFPLSFYDGYLDQLDALAQRRDSVTMSINMSRTSLDALNSRLNDIARQRRALADQRERGTSDPATQKRFEWNAERLQLLEELTQANRELIIQTLENQKLEQEIVSLTREILTRTANWIRENVHFDQEDLDKQIQALQTRMENLRTRITSLMEQRNRVERAAMRAQTQATEAVIDQDKAVTAAMMKALEAFREYYQRTLEYTETQLSILSDFEAIWRIRYQYLAERETDNKESKPENVQKNIEMLRDEISTLENAIRFFQGYQVTLQSRVTTLQREEDSESLPFYSLVAPQLRSELRALRDLIEANGSHLALLLQAAQRYQRLYDELEKIRRGMNLTERVNILWQDRVMSIWNMELWVIDNSAVTVRKVILAFAIFFLGLWGAKAGTRWLNKKLRRRFEIERDAAAAIQRIIYYVLVIIVFLFTLKMVNIPLTAFTIIFSAFSVGLGLGLKDLFANMVTGFFLLLHKPFRTQDVIEVNGITATVQEIGARYTILRTFDNKEVMMPNNVFFTNQVTNWTLSDKITRNKLTVGVGYDSPAEKVEELLLDVVKNHLKIQKKPAPFVVFQDFGDSALLFDLYFWVDMNIGVGMRVASDLRFRILERCRAEGISIAFPQRDLHLHTPRPLELRFENPEQAPRPGRDGETPPSADKAPPPSQEV
ncbi:mechanosensitive ion channel domain-containing protein [Aminiphilus circumscriptus]|uniref:mechanosensitive ion channel domain-containing protein n=1 Tax=Aminiphilus circumscriptus TaxID=290732 RepID=UPI0004785D44|nr:mechanosensitive ion channel domain-containing protein [Aminiphilus circumscriptus]